MTLYFVMANHNDAKPIIDYFDMKKDVAPCPFEVFRADDIVLCLSGEGRSNTAAATAYILTRWGKDGLFVHLEPWPGKCNVVIYPNIIIDLKEIVYQEMLYKLPSFIEEVFVEDIEGLYAFTTAAHFLPLKQIIILKTPDKVDKRTLGWLENIKAGLQYTNFSLKI
ncbi:MAG: hypothetical protein FWG65_08970 [Turicibacter sp.]|nr:hypothetical protein [Turicibacter sp.]